MAGLTAARLYADVGVRGADKARRDLAGVGKQADRTQGSLGKIGKGAGSLAKGLGRIGLVAASAVAGGLVVAAKAAGDFEDKLQIIGTIAVTSGQSTREGLSTIGEGIRKLARDTGADLGDLSDGYYDLLSAGIKVSDAQGVLDQAFKLGRGALGSTSEAVDVLTTALNAYGLQGKDARTVSDQLAQAVAAGKLKLTDIAGSFADIAPIAAQYKVGINEIAASYGFLTAKGVDASEVTTQMSRAILELAKPSGALKKLEKATGTSYLALAGKQGLVVALEQLRADAGKQKIPLTELFGRVEGLKFLFATTGENASGYAAALGEVDKSTQGAGTTQAQYAERQRGLNLGLQRLKQNALSAAITVGEGLAPAVGRLADKLSDFVSKHDDDLKSFGQGVGDAIDKIDFAKVEAGAETMVGLLRAGLDVLKQIPPEVGVAVLAFAGLNKLSGGLLGEGVSGIAGGLAGAGARGLAAKLPGVGRIFAQPVFVTNWPLGGLGGGAGAAAGGGRLGGLAGKVGGAVAAVGSVILVGEAINTWNEVNAGIKEQTAVVHSRFDAFLAQSPTKAQLDASIRAQESIPDSLDPIQRALFEINAGGVKTTWEEGLAALRAAAEGAGTTGGNLSDDLRAIPPAVRQSASDTASRLAARVDRLDRTTSTSASGTYRHLDAQRREIARGGDATRRVGAIFNTQGGRIYEGTQGVKRAIQNKDLSVTVNVASTPVNVKLDSRLIAHTLLKYYPTFR